MLVNVSGVLVLMVNGKICWRSRSVYVAHYASMSLPTATVRNVRIEWTEVLLHCQ